MKTTAIIAGLGFLLLLSGCATKHREPTELSRKLAVAFQKDPGECIPRFWLVEEVAVEALPSDRRANAAVISMARSIQAGDKVFFYSSPPETWAALLGRSGFAVIRDGKPITCVDTIVN